MAWSDGSPAYYHVWTCKKCGFRVTKTTKSSNEPTPHTAQTCRANPQNYGKHELTHSVTKK